jgi:rhodanese-related sulfurtransferase
MKRGQNIFAQLQIFEEEINRLESKVLELETKIEKLIQIERNHLTRVKNKESLSDDFILNGKEYLDLPPDRAWNLYKNNDFDFLLLDVSSSSFEGERLPEAYTIPWDELPDRFLEIKSKSLPILVISEDGKTSVLACEFLAKRGYFNCNNISGGYKFWVGHRLREIKKDIA